MAVSSRDMNFLRGMLELLTKAVAFSHYVVCTTLPRGGLQIAMTSVGGDALLKSYSRGFQSQDRLTWGAIKQDKPVKPADVWAGDSFADTDYWRELMAPNELGHVISLPLKSPILPGYPGAVHLCRKASGSGFASAEIADACEIVGEAESQQSDSRSLPPQLATAHRSPSAAEALLVLDAGMHPLLHQGEWSGVDARVREQMVEQARRRIRQLNGTGILADRVHFPDSHGNVIVFRVVTYRQYPALGEGAMSFFCPQPRCSEWAKLRSIDFQADTELARLIPALAYMQDNFQRGPTLPQISEKVGLSPFHFHRRFTELLGLTPKDFLFECQIYQAKAMLQAGDRELAEIADECGFAHQSHFTSRFKQATGLTPTRWRRMMSERRLVSEN